jgi:hypothetical protein
LASPAPTSPPIRAWDELELHVRQQAYRRPDPFAAGQTDVGELLRLFGQAADVVEGDGLGDILGQVEDVVHGGDQTVDLLPAQGRDEGLVQELNRLVGDAVGAALDLVGRLGVAHRLLARLTQFMYQRRQLLAALHDQFGMGIEKLEKPALLRHESGEHVFFIAVLLQRRQFSTRPGPIPGAGVS